MRYRISVLGTSILRDDQGHRIDSVLQQPRRFALLVYLALESRSGPVRRDTVLGVFWPDKPQDKARGSLKQAIHYLRRSLGPDAIHSGSESLQVNRDVVSCDAAELLEACDEGRWDQVANLYGGDLLPGHFDSGSSPDFEHWLETTRTRIRSRAAGSAWALAERDESRGQVAGASVWARRACEWSQGEEAQVRRLMEMLNRLGDRGGVLEAYRTLRRSLDALGTSPSPSTRELMEEIQEEWGPKEADPVPVEMTETSVPTGDPDSLGDEARVIPPDSGSGPTARRTRWPHFLRQAASVAVTVGLMVGILSLWGLTRVEAPPTPRPATVVIESMAADEANTAVAEMLRDEVIMHLQEMTGLRIVAEADEDELARDRGFVVTGNLLGMEDEFRGSFRLVDGTSGTTLAGTRMERSITDLPGGLDAMARSVANFVRREVGSALEERRLLEADVPASAITAMKLGRQDMELAASLRQDRSEDAAVAAYEKADSMFVRAGEIAPSWELPWIGRAEAAYHLMWLERHNGETDRAAERNLIRRGIGFADEAILRNQRQAESLELRALLHEWLWILSQPDASGQSAEILARAEEDARQATQLDPYRARAWNVLGATLLYQGQWGDAYWALGRAVAADTHLKDDTEILHRLFTAAWESGNAEGARAWCTHLEERKGDGWAAVNCQMYLMTDGSSPDLQRVQELRIQAQRWPYWSSIAPHFNALAAVLHARAGDVEGARAILSRLPESPEGTDVPYLEAWALLELGDKETARERITEYVAAYPSLRSSVLGSRRLRDLKPSE